MIHPYGAIGDDVQFGSTHADYVAEAQHIKIYTEQIEDATIVDQIAKRSYVPNASVFSGLLIIAKTCQY